MNRLTEERRSGATLQEAKKAWVKTGHLSADNGNEADAGSITNNNNNPDIVTSNGIAEYDTDITDITGLITDSLLPEGERYIYDLCGNRTRKETIRNGLVDLQETYCYNEKNQLTERQSSAGITRYSYDLNGNLQSENGIGKSREYRYDLLDRQTLIQTGKE